MAPDTPALREKIDACPKIADPTDRLRCISNGNTDVIETISKADASNYPQEFVIDFPAQMDTFRQSEQWLCHAQAGMAPTSDGRTPAIDACLARRELSLAKIIVQTFYKAYDVQLAGPLTVTCPKPEVPPSVADPNNEFLAGREARSQEAVLAGWAECYRGAVRDERIEKPVLDFAVNWAVNICNGIANGAFPHETHKNHMAESECATRSLYLLQQDIDAP